MATKTKTAKADQQKADQDFMAGLQKHEATIPSLIIAGVPVPTTNLISTLQSRITARTTTVTSRASWQDDVQAEKVTIAQSKPTVSGARQAIKVMFAGQTETLGDFGLTRQKAPTPLTTEQKAAARAKAEATREARHTMGSKQKAKIKGAVAAPAVAPSPDPATAPAAAPGTASASGASVTAAAGPTAPKS